jgi:hypothetical protein
MLGRLVLVGVLGLSTMSACGGLVLFDPDATGTGGGSASGAGGSVSGAGGGATSGIGVGTSVQSGSVASSSSGDNCFALGEELDRTTSEAVGCNPTIDLLQCNGSELLFDRCGCKSVVANETKPELVQAARAAYDAWVAAGCGPFDCGGACASPMGGQCDPQSGTCIGFLPD